MGLYSRAEYEDDIAQVEMLEHKATQRLVAGKIDGFRFNQIRDQLQDMRQSFDGKIRITALMVAENKVVARETKNCEITGHKRRHPCCAVCRKAR